MKPRQTWLLALLVALPVITVGVLGFLFVQQGQVKLRAQARELAQQRLSELNRQVCELIDSHARELVEALDRIPLTATGSRELVRRHRLVEQVFILDARDRLIHPDTAGSLSHSELAFVDRSRLIWESGVQLRAPHDGEETERRDHGWYTWYWGEGLRVILWRYRDDHIVGCEVARAALMADIIAQLPTDTNARPYASKIRGVSIARSPRALRSRTTLTDTQNRTLYQWGMLSDAETEAPFVSLAVCAPLEAWSWHYYTSPIAIDRLGRTALFNVMAGIGLLMATLVGVAILFHRESTRQAREAEQRVSFVNRVSHELKTPLTNIRMYAELLDAHLEEADGKVRHYSRVVIDESERLGRLIGNVLTYARQARKSFTINLRPCNVVQVVASCAELFKPGLAEAGIGIALDRRDAGDGECMADPDALKQIMGNLLSNMEKHAKGATTARVVVTQAHATTVITAQDDGAGLPKHAREAIFRPFYRVGDRTNEGTSGTGIGLTISRELARMHGGDLVLEDAEHGARFKLTLHTPLLDGDER